MNISKITMATPRIRNGLSRVRGLILRRKRIAIPLVVGSLLLAPPVLTGNGTAVLTNAIILAGAVLLVRRFRMALRVHKKKR